MRSIMYLLICTLTGLWISFAYGRAGDPPVGDISERLNFYSSFIRPQKVYLHLDKDTYQAGQTIWFKAYLFDGIGHYPDTSANNVYVELINSDGKAMAMSILLAEDGYAAGEMNLHAELPEGNYILRAYTDWMRNFGEEYYYAKNMYINNPGYENMIPRIDVLKNRLFNWKIDRMRSDYQIAFFPEGGNLLAGTVNRIAFKVADALGRGREAEGEVIDDRGDVIARLITDPGLPGTGLFEIEPEPGRSYHASVSVNGVRYRNYDLPVAAEEGYALRIDREGDMIRARVTSFVRPDNPLYSDDIIIVGHTRGIVRFARSFAADNRMVEAGIEESLFPTGIAHFTVFTENMDPVAERLIFVDHEDRLSFSPVMEVAREDGNDFIEMRLMVRDHTGDPVKGTFSLSAVTGNRDPQAHSSDILSYILLGSDLKGVAGDTGFFSEPDSNRDALADLVLLTYGWRRFNWDDVLTGDLPGIKFAPGPGLTLTGQIMDPAKNESLNNYPVRLIVRSGHDDEYTTNTSRGGIFTFDSLFYEGVVEMELSSRRLPANYPPVIDLNVREGIGYDYKPGVYTRKQRITSRGKNWSRRRGVSDSPYASAPERPVTPQLYGVPDQTIYIDYETITERSMFEVLRSRATGVTFSGGQVIIRGHSSLFGSSEARFMIDGMFVDRNVFLNLYPRDVERLEIFRGTSAAIFGVRGGTGVIIAYTRRPSYTGFEDVMEISLLGYQKPNDFYSDLISLPGVFLEDEQERTVYWEPELLTGADGILHLRLPLYREISRLKFIVKGAGYEGGIGLTEFTVEAGD